MNNFDTIYVDDEMYNDHYGDISELVDKAENIPTDINILRNKELKVILVINDEPIATLYTAHDNEEFEFDIIVDSNHRGKGLAKYLVDIAIDEYEQLKDPFPEIKMNIDVVNPHMKNLLLNKGFIITDEFPGHTMMTLQEKLISFKKFILENNSNIDIQYNKALETKNKKLIETLVKQQAEQNNYKTPLLYHGSEADFNEFKHKYIGEHGTSEGIGFYFTDKLNVAKGYAEKNGKLYRVYLKILKPLFPNKKQITKNDLKKLIKKLDPKGDEFLSNWGEVGYEGYNNVLNSAISDIYDYSDNDIDLISGIINAGVSVIEVYDILLKTLGYDGIIDNDPSWGDQTIYIAFNSNQIKLATHMTTDNSGNIIPLSKRFNYKIKDIRY